MASISQMNKADLQEAAKARGIATGDGDTIQSLQEAIRAYDAEHPAPPQPQDPPPPENVQTDDDAQDYTGPGYFIVNGRHVDANGEEVK